MMTKVRGNTQSNQKGDLDKYEECWNVKKTDLIMLIEQKIIISPLSNLTL